MPELLLEIRSEDIPARMQKDASRNLELYFTQELNSYSVEVGEAKSYATSSRITLYIPNIIEKIEAKVELIKGPKITAPEAALSGFLKKNNLTLDDIKIENDVYFANITHPEVTIESILPNILNKILLNFHWPKSMKSGSSQFKWVRPLKSILYLFDNKIVPFNMNDIDSSNVTFGHRFMTQASSFEINSFQQYEVLLRENFIILDSEERKKLIRNQALLYGQDHNIIFVDDQELMEEVIGLNEYPIPLLGEIQERFLTLPSEVIQTSMKNHQKYFSFRNQDGSLASKFLIVANLISEDSGQEIIRGNQKVLTARLSDAMFFWQEDNKEGNFQRWFEKLNGVTFHAKLGSLQERVKRIVSLAQKFAQAFGIDQEVARKAAMMCKSDLVSFLVSEFPELQGVMGGYYAKNAAYGDEIYIGIRDHYKPQGPNDRLPENKIGSLLSFCDKLDTLIGFFAIDEKPTGSKDPFGLRRCALALLRLMKENNIDFSLKYMVQCWYESLMTYIDDGRELFLASDNWHGSAGIMWNDGAKITHRDKLDIFIKGLFETDVFILASNRTIGLDFSYEHLENNNVKQEVIYRFNRFAKVLCDVEQFVNTRLQVALKENGLNSEKFKLTGLGYSDAIINACVQDDLADFPILLNRIELMQSYYDEYGDALWSAYKRSHNMISSKEIMSSHIFSSVNNLIATDEKELEFIENLDVYTEKLKENIYNRDLKQALDNFYHFQDTVNEFLDNYKINDNNINIRSNRINILSKFCTASELIADFKKCF